MDYAAKLGDLAVVSKLCMSISFILPILHLADFQCVTRLLKNGMSISTENKVRMLL